MKNNLTGEIRSTVDGLVRDRLWEQVLEQIRQSSLPSVRDLARCIDDRINNRVLWQLNWRPNQTGLMKENVRQ